MYCRKSLSQTSASNVGNGFMQNGCSLVVDQVQALIAPSGLSFILLLKRICLLNVCPSVCESSQFCNRRANLLLESEKTGCQVQPAISFVGKRERAQIKWLPNHRAPVPWPFSIIFHGRLPKWCWRQGGPKLCHRLASRVKEKEAHSRVRASRTMRNTTTGTKMN